jgi:hypothetical protein
MSRRRHTPEQINGKLRDEFLNGEIFYTLPGRSSSSSSGGGCTIPSDHTAPGAVYPPTPEAVKLSPWFLRMPQLQGPPMAQRLT